MSGEFGQCRDWMAIPHPTMYTNIRSGPGVNANDPAITAYEQISRLFREVETDLSNGIRQLQAGYEGGGSTAAQGAIGGLSMWTTDAQDGSRLASSNVQTASNAYASARNGMPEPVRVTAEDGVLDNINDFFGGTTPREQQEQEAYEAHQRAAQVMGIYDAEAGSAALAMPEWTPPAPTTVEVTGTPPSAEQVGPQPTTATNVGGGTPPGGGGGPTPPTVSTPPTTTTPDVPPGGPRSPGPGPITTTPTPPQGPGGNPPAPRPPAPVPSNPPPRSGGSGPGVLPPGVLRRPDVGRVPRPPGSGGGGASGGGRQGGRGGARPAAPDSNLRGRPGLGQPDIDDDRSRGRTSAGVGAEDGRTRGPAGAGLDDPRARGAGAVPPPVGATGRRQDGEDDGEHKRPDYLVETEDVWGDGRKVSPPVIGE